MPPDAPAILVLAPMPACPASAGNRRRLVATCAALMRGGFAVDLAYYAHEDQIYRRFGQHPPTDFSAMQAAFRQVFLIETRTVIPLKTRSPAFGLDDWCPPEVDDFVAWYCARHPETRAVVANYVFLSRALTRVPPGMLRLIDTHDRFAGRQTQYRPFRAEPNFFYTDATGEAAGLARADIVLAIQAEEARAFAGATEAHVLLLPPLFPPRRPFAVPERIARIGFLGHGNDPNLFSIGRFAQAWAEGWSLDRPELVVAGEICASLAGIEGPGVRLLGYLDRLEDFYDAVDLVVAPMLMGSGLKMKVGEALSFGVPVVATAIGCEGFSPVLPAHRCRDAQAVKAAVLEAARDADARARLTEASAALFAGYAAVAEESERALIALLRTPEAAFGDRPSRDPGRAFSSPRTRGEGRDDRVVRALSPTDPGLARDRQAKTEVGQAQFRAGRGDALDEAERATLSGGGLVLTCEHSARSLHAADPALGLLVATERRPGDGTAQSYAPLRRRWFARAGTTDGDPPALGVLDVALAPEWVRGRALPPAARAALARAFADMAADWETRGRVVGRAGDRIEIETLLPGVLAAGSHPAAAFLLSGEAAVELRLERVTPLQLRSVAPYADCSGRLPAPVPVSLALRADAPLPPGGTRLLLITDDGIGRIALGPEAPAP